MLSPEDRTVYKWIVTWAQGKLSGEKAPLGAAVPAKLPMEPEHILTKAKTKRRGQGQRAKRRRAASSRPSRKEDKATGPAPPAREEDPAPAASGPDDVPWKIVDCHRRTKRKRENSTSSPTKASKHPSAPSPPPQPGKQCYCCQGFGHKSRTCCLPPVCAQCSGSLQPGLHRLTRRVYTVSAAAPARRPVMAFVPGSTLSSLPVCPGRPIPLGRQHSLCPPWTWPPSVRQRRRHDLPSSTP